MKKSEVPQDDSSLKSKNINEVCYAVDESGNYIQVASTGWSPKTTVLNETLALLQERIDEAKKLVKEGKKSPILYFMELNKMDIALLASYTGFWKITIQRHFKPSVFKKLSDRKLQKYAHVFGIDINELKHFNVES